MVHVSCSHTYIAPQCVVADVAHSAGTYNSAGRFVMDSDKLIAQNTQADICHAYATAAKSKTEAFHPLRAAFALHDPPDSPITPTRNIPPEMGAPHTSSATLRGRPDGTERLCWYSTQCDGSSQQEPRTALGGLLLIWHLHLDEHRHTRSTGSMCDLSLLHGIGSPLRHECSITPPGPPLLIDAAHFWAHSSRCTMGFELRMRNNTVAQAQAGTGSFFLVSHTPLDQLHTCSSGDV